MFDTVHTWHQCQRLELPVRARPAQTRPASNSDEDVHILGRPYRGGRVRSNESFAFCMRHTLERRALYLAASRTQQGSLGE